MATDPFDMLDAAWVNAVAEAMTAPLPVPGATVVISHECDRREGVVVSWRNHHSGPRIFSTSHLSMVAVRFPDGTVAPFLTDEVEVVASGSL